MSFLNKRELKIFLTFFILYSFFVQWTSWNEESRLALTQAIVEEKGFEIDAFHNKTGDKIFFQGHYYSDKNPGTSFLALPIYTCWRFINKLFLSRSMNPSLDSSELVYYQVGIPFVYNPHPSFFLLGSMFFVTVFVSSLFSALTVLLIYKISAYFTKKENYRILLVISYGLGTLALPYSLVFLDHASITFFAFLSFCLLFVAKRKKTNDNKLFFVAGLAAGFAVVITFLALLFLPVYFIYLAAFKRRKIPIFFLGFLIGILPLLFYNYFVFRNFFFSSSSTQGIHGFLPSLKIKGLTLEVPLLKGVYIFLSPQSFNVLTRLLFSPYKGIFFYNPILLLSFLGMFYMFRKERLEAILFLLVFILFVIFFTMTFTFFCGFCFGFRYLLPVVPFLILPLSYVFEKVNPKIVFIPILISIFFSILSLQFWESIQILSSKPLALPFEEEYQQRFLNFQILANPLADHYLPLFIKNGPRSRIFESLLLDSNIDIRNTPHSCGLTSPIIKKAEIPLFSLSPLGIVVLRVPFLCLVPLAVIMFLIWRKELLKRLKISFRKGLFVLFILTLIFCGSFVRIRELVYGKNWYAPEFHDGKTEENERWMSQNATLILFNKNDGKEKVNFVFDAEAFNMTRVLELYLNDNLIGSYEVSNKKTISQEMELKPGENIVMFYSVQDCDRPTELGLADCDLRCLSFKIGNIHTIYIQ